MKHIIHDIIMEPVVLIFILCHALDSINKYEEKHIR